MRTEPLENLIYSYLLGDLSEVEQSALEQKLLADREKFDEAWAIENRLIDHYVRGKLQPADRERFERHYLASDLHRERVSIAELFLKDIDETAEQAPLMAEMMVQAEAPDLAKSWWSRLLESLRAPQLVLGAAMATALLLATCGAVWLFVERSRLTDQLAQAQNQSQSEARSGRERERELAAQKQELETEIAMERERGRRLDAELERLRQGRRSTQPSAPSAFFSFLLTPATTRDKNGPPPPTIPFVKSDMRLLMELDGSDYPDYRIRLQTVEGREILSKPASKTRLGKDGAFATITLPAGTLTRGDYILVLSGRTARGAQEEIDQYFFRVQ